jgi:sulfur-oxidizing protein SoxX
MMRGAALCAIATALSACGAPPPALVGEPDIVGDAIPAPLATTGDATRGRALFVARDGGHCVLCHAIEGLEAEFQGDIGPPLTQVGARLDTGQIRLRIADASRLNPETIMPPYYRIAGLNHVSADYVGRPALSGQDIEDLVAFLSSLKDAAS